jgi:eukaryotic-like serine/threonine-protein kinase
VQIWDPSTGHPLLTYRGHPRAVWAVTWSPKGTYIASGSEDETVQVWDVATGKHVFTYSGHVTTGTTPQGATQGTVHALTWSPDGQRIASASLDTTVRVWKAP